MFGLPLYSELIQGSAERTWNCVSCIANFLWCRLFSSTESIMPRSRRRQHSRSRSRSRSRSHDKDREPKRRKIETAYDSPHKQSVSSEPGANENQKDDFDNTIPTTQTETLGDTSADVSQTEQTCVDSSKLEKSENELEASTMEVGDAERELDESTSEVTETSSASENILNESKSEAKMAETDGVMPVTPKRTLTSRQLQRKLESEKKKLARQQEREELEKKKQEERDEKKKVKDKLKYEKDEQKQKEKELKEKEREQKKKEKEEKEEKKRKERDDEKLKKQQELDEKNKEKKKQEEIKQKVSAAFVNFFIPKKQDSVEDGVKEETHMFMPFEIKSDMRLAPTTRKTLKDQDKEHLMSNLESQNIEQLYLKELKNGKSIGKSAKTWIQDDDCFIIDDLGENIQQDETKSKMMRVKFLKFHENQRPPYYGTWRKKTKLVNPRKPFVMDSEMFNYEIDSDEEWEDEEDGESLDGGSDKDEKENESENDYEVDNDIFVPHGHLSDDEMGDEEEKMCPETFKMKLKLLRKEFEEERQEQVKKVKPRFIGCVWDKKDKSENDPMHQFLQAFAVITNNIIVINKRAEDMTGKKKKAQKCLEDEHIPDFLRFVHGNENRVKPIINEFLKHFNSNNKSTTASKLSLRRHLQEFAEYKMCAKEGPMHNKQCWMVREDIQKKHNVSLELLSE